MSTPEKKTVDFGYCPAGSVFVEVETVDLNTGETISRRSVPKADFFSELNKKHQDSKTDSSNIQK